MSIFNPFSKIINDFSNKIIGFSLINEDVENLTPLNFDLRLVAGQNITTSGTTVTAWTSLAEAPIDVATIVGTPDQSSAGGIELTGTEYFTLSGDTSNFQGITETGIFSFGMKIRMDNIGAPQQTFLQTKSNGRGIFVGTTGGAGFRFRAFNSSNAVLWNHDVDLSSFTNGDEIDFVVLGDGSNSYCYLNNVLSDTQTITLQAGVHQFPGTVGRYSNVSSGFLDGAVNGIVYAPEFGTVSQVNSALSG
jgi:hypothetical protein